MRFSDLLTMSVNNLFRRKLRTFLTVLGVVIGTASIVVMVSIGIGLKEFTIKQYSSYGSLTAIRYIIITMEIPVTRKIRKTAS